MECVCVAKVQSSTAHRTLGSAMSSGLVRCVFDSFMEIEEPKDDSSRMHSAQEFGRAILGKISTNELAMTAFDAFSSELTTCLRGVFKPNETYRSRAAKREKLWTAFHQVRFSEVPSIWGRFFASQGILHADQFFLQSVTQKLFEKLLLREFSADAASSSHPINDPSSEQAHTSLTEDELNALRYACGYIPHNLLKKFQRRSGTKYDQFVECLGEMAVCGDNDTDGIHKNLDR